MVPITLEMKRLPTSQLLHLLGVYKYIVLIQTKLTSGKPALHYLNTEAQANPIVLKSLIKYQVYMGIHDTALSP